MTELSNRVHLFAHPSAREDLDRFFTDVLSLPPASSVAAPGLDLPILIYQFENGASLSVQFGEDALGAEEARRGAWLELVADDADRLKEKVLRAGLRRLEHLGGEHFYFQAPGGQVMRIVSPDQL
ncbi:MAG: hypothetical protein H0W90_09500 [Actinobacteria bacterium]|nr:hypothetical protein [Actinomycetota bacterium]